MESENDQVSYDEPDRVDWLDLGPDPDEGATPPDPRRRYLWYGAAAALVALALALTQTQHGTGTSRTAASPRPASPTSPSSAPALTLSPGPASSGSFVDPPPTSSVGLAAVARIAPLKVTTVGHPLLDVPADWELFGQGPGVVVRIELARGRITTTAVPVTNGNSAVAFVVGPDRAFVRSMSGPGGYVVRDGKRVAELPAPLRTADWVLPGPDQRHLWAKARGGDPSELALVNLDGRPTGATINVPIGASVQGPDGAGYVLLVATGGTWDARPGSVRRITTGMLLAAGPTRWLTWECDDSLTCANVIVERAGGARRNIGAAAQYGDPNVDVLSPDGRTVALLQQSDGISASDIQLLDLESGLSRSVEVAIGSTEPPNYPRWAWSPDSRWLFVTDAAGQVVIVNRRTGKTTPLGIRLPPVTQLVVRHSTS